YTDMNTQPWVFDRHPFGYLWTRDLLQAIATGFIDRDLVAEHVRQGWVRPSLLVQVDEQINDPLLLSLSARRLDRDFVAPFRAFGKPSRSSATNLASVAKAKAR